MNGRRTHTWIGGLAAIIALAWIGDAQAAGGGFLPIDNWALILLNSLQGNWSLAIGFVVIVGMIILFISTRGHGPEFLSYLLLAGAALAVLFQAVTFVFPLLGFTGGVVMF